MVTPNPRIIPDRHGKFPHRCRRVDGGLCAADLRDSVAAQARRTAVSHRHVSRRLLYFGRLAGRGRVCGGDVVFASVAGTKLPE